METRVTMPSSSECISDYLWSRWLPFISLLILTMLCTESQQVRIYREYGVGENMTLLCLIQNQRDQDTYWTRYQNNTGTRLGYFNSQLGIVEDRNNGTRTRISYTYRKNYSENVSSFGLHIVNTSRADSGWYACYEIIQQNNGPSYQTLQEYNVQIIGCDCLLPAAGSSGQIYENIFCVLEGWERPTGDREVVVRVGGRNTTGYIDNGRLNLFQIDMSETNERVEIEFKTLHSSSFVRCNTDKITAPLISMKPTQRATPSNDQSEITNRPVHTHEALITGPESPASSSTASASTGTTSEVSLSLGVNTGSNTTESPSTTPKLLISDTTTAQLPGKTTDSEQAVQSTFESSTSVSTREASTSTNVSTVASSTETTPVQIMTTTESVTESLPAVSRTLTTTDLTTQQDVITDSLVTRQSEISHATSKKTTPMETMTTTGTVSESTASETTVTSMVIEDTTTQQDVTSTQGQFSGIVTASTTSVAGSMASASTVRGETETTKPLMTVTQTRDSTEQFLSGRTSVQSTDGLKDTNSHLILIISVSVCTGLGLIVIAVTICAVARRRRRKPYHLQHRHRCRRGVNSVSNVRDSLYTPNKPRLQGSTSILLQGTRMKSVDDDVDDEERSLSDDSFDDSCVDPFDDFGIRDDTAPASDLVLSSFAGNLGQETNFGALSCESHDIHGMTQIQETPLVENRQRHNLEGEKEAEDEQPFYFVLNKEEDLEEEISDTLPPVSGNIYTAIYSTVV